MPQGKPSFGETQFFDWLTRQRDRRDPVGSFAKDAWQDASFPRAVSSGQDLVSYMEGRGAKEAAVEAAKDAWIEFGGSAEDFIDPDEIADWDDADDDRP